jgi:hypothetical protein
MKLSGNCCITGCANHEVPIVEFGLPRRFDQCNRIVGVSTLEAACRWLLGGMMNHFNNMIET